RGQLGPAVEILERAVGAVVRAASHEALQVAAVVEIFFEELAGRRDVVGQQLPLQRGPPGRGHGRGDGQRRTGCSGQERRCCDSAGNQEGANWIFHGRKDTKTIESRSYNRQSTVSNRQSTVAIDSRLATDD